MKRKSTFNKMGLYILSLMLLFVFIIILSAKIPFCYGSSCHFIGFYQLASSNADCVTITACQSESYESLTFLATYIVPFMGFSFDDPQKNIAYFLLIVVIGLIFIKTDKYYANPTLALFGYKLYRVNISHAGSGEVKNVIAISMDVLTVDDQVFYSFFDDYVFIARKK